MSKNWSNEQAQAFQKSWAKLVAKAWGDSAFKERLIKNPKSVLKEEGIEFPTDLDCKIVENNDKIVYLHLPKKPDGKFTEDQLKQIAAGGINTPWTEIIRPKTKAL